MKFNQAVTYHTHVSPFFGIPTLPSEVVIKAGLKVDLEQVADMSRKGQTGARNEGDIGFAVLRGGDVAGEHSVIFFGESERFEITHRANDRVIFARGALRAARFAAKAVPGFYNMNDVLKV